MCVCVYMDACTYDRVCVLACVRVYMDACTYDCVCICVCACACARVRVCACTSAERGPRLPVVLDLGVLAGQQRSQLVHLGLQ